MTAGENPIPSKDELDAVFGSDSRGATVDERARSSGVRIGRSQHQITRFREGAPGRSLTALEAIQLFGWSIVRQLADRDAVPILIRAQEPFATLLNRAAAIGLDFEAVTTKLGWSKASQVAFGERTQVPFRDLERAAQALALDERQLGLVPEAAGDSELGVRLRTLLHGDAARFTRPSVLALAEAAWVVDRQSELQEQRDKSLATRVRDLGFVRSNNYSFPAWKVGFDLAHQTRRLLSLPEGEPIDKLKELIETKLAIPVVQLELDDEFAGATISNGRRRGIGINLKGGNQHPEVRRMTMAHELGHLLWDPDQRLSKLVVDSYSELEARPEARADVVERRANGFAVELLAPQASVKLVFEQADDKVAGLTAVASHFGISRTAARYQIENAYDRTVDLSSAIRLARIPDSDKWEAGELLMVPVFRPESVPVSRRGQFAIEVLRAFDDNRLSKDSVASLLGCGVAETDRALMTIRQFL